jgi:hypothetical protein
VINVELGLSANHVSRSSVEIVSSSTAPASTSATVRTAGGGLVWATLAESAAKSPPRSFSVRFEFLRVGGKRMTAVL